MQLHQQRTTRAVHLLLLAVLLAGTLLPLFPARPVFAQEAPTGDVAPAAVDDVAPAAVDEVAPAAVDEVSQVFVNQPITDFYISNGMAYWSNSCSTIVITAAAGEGEAAGGEVAPAAPVAPTGGDDPAYLRRTPASGVGTITTVATAQGGRAICTTYYMPTVDADGVYYYVKTGTTHGSTPVRIEFRPGGTTGEPVVVANVNDSTAPRYFDGGGHRRFATDATYVYWGTETGVLRARKDGTTTTPEVVAGGFANPNFVNDVLVVGGTLFIAAENGVFRCGLSSLPCSPTQLSPNGGQGLAYRTTRGGSGPIALITEQLYWVSGETIRRWSCSIIIVCLPGDTIVHNRSGNSTNYYLGRPAFHGDNMFWKEGNGDNVNSGQVMRKDISNLANPAGPINTDALYGYSSFPVYIERAYVYFYDFQSGSGTFIKRLPVTAPFVTRDLKADGLEITQGIQNLASAAPLAAKKTTFVRAYAVSLEGPRSNGVRALLYGTRGGSPLPGSPLSPTNGTRSLVTGGSYDRAILNDGWLFAIPPSWVNTPGAAGEVTFRLVVDPHQSYFEDPPDRANNELTKTIRFENQPPACVIYVPVRTNNPRPSTSMPNFWDMVGRFSRRWPMPSIKNFTTSWQAEEPQVCWWGPFPYPCSGPFELNEGASISDWIPDKDEVIIQLWGFNVFNDAPGCGGSPTHIMGMVHPNAPTGNVAGYASLISSESWVKLPPASPNPFPNTWGSMGEAEVMAQELTHNYGRKHVNCGNPGDIDTGYPYPPCQIANTGQTSYYGFDSKTLTPIAPNAAADFMSYRSPAWVSDYTWRAVMNAAASSTQVQAAAADLRLIVSADGTVYATGHVDTQKHLGQLSSVKVLPDGTLSAAMAQKLVAAAVGPYHGAAPAAVEPSHGVEPHLTDFHLRLVAANGATVDDRDVQLLPLDDHDTARSAQIFLASFPAPAQQVAKVQLLHLDTVLDEIAPGPGTPIVTLSQPAGGVTIGDTMTVAWNAGDPDDDPLVFNLQYSYDNGTTWQALTGDIGSTPDPDYQIVIDDLSALHGSAPNAARVRVIASDGYNTAVALSQGFTMPNRPPVAFITDPSPGQYYDPQGPALLQGGATDAEDSLLEDGALVWRLGSTEVATGTSALLNGLAPGFYAASLTATDSVSNSGTATATLAVAPLNIPQGSAPTIDGVCDDTAYAASAQVALAAYDAENQATVRLLRSEEHLYACFSGLKAGTPPAPAEQGPSVGLRIDVDHSRDAQAQDSDFGFFVGEDGGFFTRAGNGAGGFDEPGPGGLQAQVSGDANGTTWNAEMRIEQDRLGGWDHLVGLKAGHYRVAAPGDDYAWPYTAPGAALPTVPASWGTTVLGLLPVIDAIAPISATVGSPTLQVTVEGQNIAANAVVLWNSTVITPVVAAALAPTLDASEQAAAAEAAAEAAAAGESVEASAVAASTVLTVEVPASLLATAGSATVRVRNPGPLDSPTVTLAINNPTPVITSLAPTQVQADGPGFTLTVHGSGFVGGAAAYWDGLALTTTVDNSGRLRAEVPASLLALGGEVGITVRNPAPVANDSNAAVFTVLPEGLIYLPTIEKD